MRRHRVEDASPTLISGETPWIELWYVHQKLSAKTHSEYGGSSELELTLGRRLHPRVGLLHCCPLDVLHLAGYPSRKRETGHHKRQTHDGAKDTLDAAGVADMDKSTYLHPNNA